MTDEIAMETQYSKNTPMEEIDSRIRLCNGYFYDKQLQLSKERSPRKADLKQRSIYLKKLFYGIRDNTDALIDAMYSDFHRSKQESLTLEVIQVLNCILSVLEKLPSWIEPKKLTDCSAPYLFGKIRVESIARGSVLVIGPFNFPLLSSLIPAVYALAGGNSVIVKPSEMTPATANCIEKCVKDAGLPDGLLQIVKGAQAETERLVQSGKFDMIFFTGSNRVGSIIAQEAAKTVTPCALELGGKSPVFMTKNLHRKNIRTALKRIFFSSFGNSGQICVAPDYVLVHESIYDQVVQEAKEVLKELYPEITPDAEYTHMINKKAFDSVSSSIASSKGDKFVVDNQYSDAETLMIPPTLVFDVEWDDSLMEKENFGPVLPFIRYSDLDRTLDTVVEKQDTPLVQYIFSQKDQEVQRILARLRSGDCIVGDTLIHVGINGAPFGGIGSSGYGNFGFNTFTHQRTILKQPYWMDAALAIRYPPFKAWKSKAFRLAVEKKPWFDRNGNDRFGFLKWFALSLAILVFAIALSKC
ncbi:hypothetical protein HG537_0A03650 [Torulaspora globosa]|uniref:Aldehyde dehydrogenase n=1 Tax=Torulaspora globosa TaxID=48254 RepID=A0A7H9HJP9_9SACH|nr:hypothetical protein HG537_0A03650 [Torulaspora sp. CBS 2947]